MPHGPDDPPDASGPLSSAIELVRPGSLLLASTGLRGPVFQRTVVYILEHDAGGTFGLVVNRPTDVPLGAVAPAWEYLAAEPRLVHRGGPVVPDGLFCLGLLRHGADFDHTPGLTLVKPGAGPDSRLILVNLDADATLVATVVERVRIFAGYSGWAGGQLAGELSRGSWYVAQAQAQDVFAELDVDLWGQVVRRQGAKAAVLATHPIDVEAN